MCCNQLFYFQALWPDGDVAADEGDLVDILEAISVHAHKLHNHGTTSTDEDNKKTENGKIGGNTTSSSTGFISDSVKCIDDQCQKDYTNSLSALGVLTSLGRNQWAKTREEIIAFSPAKNAESFQIIDSALFVLVLDDYIPKNKHEAAANMLHGSYELSERSNSSKETGSYNNEYQSGSCTNRWYDKLQVSTST